MNLVSRTGCLAGASLGSIGAALAAGLYVFIVLIATVILTFCYGMAGLMTVGNGPWGKVIADYPALWLDTVGVLALELGAIMLVLTGLGFGVAVVGSVLMAWVVEQFRNKAVDQDQD